MPVEGPPPFKVVTIDKVSRHRRMSSGGIITEKVTFKNEKNNCWVVTAYWKIKFFVWNPSYPANLSEIFSIKMVPSTHSIYAETLTPRKRCQTNLFRYQGSKENLSFVMTLVFFLRKKSLTLLSNYRPFRTA